MFAQDTRSLFGEFPAIYRQMGNPSIPPIRVLEEEINV